MGVAIQIELELFRKFRITRSTLCKQLSILKFDTSDGSAWAALCLANVDSPSICEIVEDSSAGTRGRAFLHCILAKVRRGTAKPNFLFRDGSSTTWSSRPLGDNEPKVTTTGWCLCYCCRWLPAELDGAWPRFPWFTEVPNRVSPLKTSLARADYIMSLSTYMAPTYVLRASSSTSLLRQPLCSIALLLDSTNSYRSSVALCKLRLRERYLIRATRHARIRKICRALWNARKTKGRELKEKRMQLYFLASKIAVLKNVDGNVLNELKIDTIASRKNENYSN